MKKIDIDIDSFVNEYQNTYVGLETLCLKYHIGKLRGKKILEDNNVELRDCHSTRKTHNYVVSDWRIEKYQQKSGYHYEVFDNKTDFVSKDYMNSGGFLTTYIKNTYGIETPSLYFRREYYMTTGNYWWEQWLTVRLVEDTLTKKCPYCDWTTVDLDNKSGAFELHLKKSHNMSIEQYLSEHPEDEYYFSNYTKKKKRDDDLVIPNNSVVCPICNKKYWRITESHLLSQHKMTMAEFREKFSGIPVMSNNNLEQTREAQKLGNLSVSKDRFISKYEQEIRDYLTENGVTFEANRQLLIGREIDILIPDKKIGIEFDGLKWHTEWFGKKKHRYHVDKTEKCNQAGYGLIHIFEDEYVNNKALVLEKLGHILNLPSNDVPVAARKCTVKEITKTEAKDFLTKYHIQGFVSSTLYTGAFYNNELIAVMCFKNGNIKNDSWELVRFAGKTGYRLQGVGGKMFSYFISKESPNSVVSFADRRWTLWADNNLYTKLGFKLEKICPPDYKYYNDKVDKYKRIHKMSFSKKELARKYGFSMDLTEKEMALQLGYDRIWDCGLFKYVWYK